MRRSLLPGALSVLFATGAAAQDASLANWMMPGCRAFMNDAVESEPFRAGLCAGLISGLSFIGPKGGLCLPAGVTNTQLVRVVVAHIDRTPARLHENFKFLAFKALTDAWPCPDEK